MNERRSEIPRQAIEYKTVGATALKERPKQTYLHAVDQQPILPEPHVSAEDFYTEAFAEDFRELERLRSIWKIGLAAAGIEEPEGVKNFEVAKERRLFELCVTEEEKEQFWQEAYRQVLTALWERYSGDKVEFTLNIGLDGKLHSELLKTEPLLHVYERGRVEKAIRGSKEPERDLQEIKGLEKLEAKLADPNTPQGSIFFIPSGEGIVEGTENVANFVDAAVLLEPTEWQDGVIIKEGKVLFVRFRSTLDYKQYREIAKRINPHFFRGYQGPIDAWFKGNFLTSEEFFQYEDVYAVFEEFFGKQHIAGAMVSFQELVKEANMPLLIPDLLEKIMSDDFASKVVEIALTYHGIIVEWDKAEKRLVQRNIHTQYQEDERLDISRVSQTPMLIPFSRYELTQEEKRYVAAQVQRNHYEEAETRKVDCGSSAGIKIRRKALGRMFANTVGARGINSLFKINSKGEVIDEDAECENFLCDRDPGDNHYHCPDCSKTYDDETSRAPEDRTPACSCGKELGCGKVVSLDAFREEKARREADKKQEKKDVKKEEKPKPIVDFAQFKEDKATEEEEK